MPRTRQKLATLDAVEEIARRVPGYKGYQELSQRREDDRRFRNIAEHLAGEAHRPRADREPPVPGRLFGPARGSGRRRAQARVLADAIGMPSPAQKSTFTDDAAESAGQIDRQILEELDQLHRPRAGEGLRSRRAFRDEPGRAARLTESLADLIEQRNVALTR